MTTTNKMKRTIALLSTAIMLSSCGNVETSSTGNSAREKTDVTTMTVTSETMATEPIEEDKAYVTDDPLIKKAVEILAADKISAVNKSGRFIDVNEDDVDEILLTGETEDGKKHLYCFFNDNGTVTLGGECEGFDGDNYRLEWRSTGKFSNPVAHVTTDTDEILYDLTFVNGKFCASVLAAKHILPDGTAEYESGGRTGYPEAEEDFYHKIYETWGRKESRFSHAVKLASECKEKGMLKDMNGDGYPELVCFTDDAEYVDGFFNIYYLDGTEDECMTAHASDTDGTLRRYYDAENDEYFCISEWYDNDGDSFGNYVQKTVIRRDSAYSEYIAWESYYTDSNHKGKYYMRESKFMDEVIDSDKFVENPNLRAYSEKLEKYLLKYELCDTIKTSDLPSQSTDKEKMRADYETQMKKIEEDYFANPHATDRNRLYKSIVSNGKNTHIDVNEDNISIDVTVMKSFADFEPFTALKNLESAYIYVPSECKSEAEWEFDLDWLKSFEDSITDITFNNVVCDTAKLKNFKNLKSLRLPNIRNENELKEIAELSGLTHISLVKGCEKYDLSVLSSLTNLESMLTDIDVKDFGFVKDMKKLSEVSFFTNSDETNCFEALSKLPNFKILAFSGHDMRATDEQMACFADRDDVICPVIY